MSQSIEEVREKRRQYMRAIRATPDGQAAHAAAERKRRQLRPYTEEQRMANSKRAMEWARRPENKERVKASTRRAYRKRKYKLSQEEFNVMIKKQEGRCAICGEFFGDDLCIDHNHETGEIRALLCRRHNLMIGQANDSPAVLVQGAKYLRKWAAKTAS